MNGSAARFPRWNRPTNQLTYLPVQELLGYLRANGLKTYIVTGGSQDFVRVYSEQTYGIPPEQVIGTAAGTTCGYDKSGDPFLTKEPKLLFNDNDAGKPVGIHLMIGRRPVAAFGNSTGDRPKYREQMRQMKRWLDEAKAEGIRKAFITIHNPVFARSGFGAIPAPDNPHNAIAPYAKDMEIAVFNGHIHTTEIYDIEGNSWGRPCFYAKQYIILATHKSMGPRIHGLGNVGIGVGPHPGFGYQKYIRVG